MTSVSAEMIMAIAALLTAGGGGWRAITEAKKMASNVKAIPGQVHNNHDPPTKDIADKMVQRMTGVQQTQETMFRVQEGQDEGISQLRQSTAQMQQDIAQLREDLTTTTRRMERIGTGEHETHKKILDRLNKEGKAS